MSVCHILCWLVVWGNVMSFKVCRLKNATKVMSAPSINSSGVANSGFPKGRQPQRGAFNLELEPVVDLRGRPRCPRRPIIFSISCSFFFGNLPKSYVGTPLEGQRTPSYGESWIRPCEPWKALLGTSPCSFLIKAKQKVVQCMTPPLSTPSLPLWGQICFAFRGRFRIPYRRNVNLLGEGVVTILCLKKTEIGNSLVIRSANDFHGDSQENDQYGP